jgi:1,4-alpha-glucan branching enzyme
MPAGSLNLVLHAHLPFIRHPEHDDFLEEDWLFEAISETYIPLMDMLGRLAADRVPVRLTLTVSPPLAEMLADPLLQTRYLRHVNRLVELAGREVSRCAGNALQARTARMYLDHFIRARDLFDRRFGRNLLAALGGLQEQGVLEIITGCATHAFLPLVLLRGARRAQVRAAVRNHQRHFGRTPRGFWFAECGYAPGDDELLAEAGLDYFFIDTHGALFGQPRPWFGAFAPVRCPSGVSAVPRDPAASAEVWSSREGYPGDFDYREFYRDLGFDAEFDYIRPFLHRDGIRRNVGIKYHRITGPVDLGDKALYDPAAGLAKAAAHAADYLQKRIGQVLHLREILGREPLVTVPFDAELFGHWWFEGPMFLEYFIRKAAFDQDTVALATTADYLDRHPVRQCQQPSLSSWGADGYGMVWLNGKNEWIYRHLHLAEERMVELARRCPDAAGLHRRYLNQAARELLLAQSSDWPFIMTTGTMVPYAVRRFKEHIARFSQLHDDLVSGSLDESRLRLLEERDPIFPEIDYRDFA